MGETVGSAILKEVRFNFESYSALHSQYIAIVKS